VKQLFVRKLHFTDCKIFHMDLLRLWHEAQLKTLAPVTQRYWAKCWRSQEPQF